MQDLIFGVGGYSVAVLLSLKLMARWGFFEPYERTDHDGRAFMHTPSVLAIAVFMPLWWIRGFGVGVWMTVQGTNRLLSAFVKNDRKVFQAKSAYEKRVKELEAASAVELQEAIQLLEKEMEGTALPALTIEQKIRRGIIECGAKDFEVLWAEAGQAKTPSVIVRRREDGASFLMRRDIVRNLQSRGSFNEYDVEEYPATEEVKG